MTTAPTPMGRGALSVECSGLLALRPSSECCHETPRSALRIQRRCRARVCRGMLSIDRLGVLHHDGAVDSRTYGMPVEGRAPSCIVALSTTVAGSKIVMSASFPTWMQPCSPSVEHRCPPGSSRSCMSSWRWRARAGCRPSSHAPWQTYERACQRRGGVPLTESKAVSQSIASSACLTNGVRERVTAFKTDDGCTSRPSRTSASWAL